MKVNNLHIERRENYDSDYPNQLVGIVQIEGEHGKMEVKLTSKVVAQIFALVRPDVKKVAEYNSKQAGQAVEEAEGEVALLEDKSGDDKSNENWPF